MIAQIAKVSIDALKAATVDYLDESDFVWKKAWTVHAGDKYVAHYSTGQASIYGPILGNKFEIQAENIETYELVAGLSASMGSIKDRARSSGLMRAAIRTSGRELIRNSKGKVVGYLPAFGLGQDPRSAFLGDEDIEAAPEIPGME